MQKEAICPINLLDDSFLTDVVEAVRLPSFGTHERHVCPFAVSVGVTLNQVVRGFSISDPVTQELAYTTSVDHSITERSPKLECSKSKEKSSTESFFTIQTHTQNQWLPSSCEHLGVVPPWAEGQGCM